MTAATNGVVGIVLQQARIQLELTPYTLKIARLSVHGVQGVFYGELFSELGLVLGSSLDPVTTNFIEPAFINDTVSPLSKFVFQQTAAYGKDCSWLRTCLL